MAMSDANAEITMMIGRAYANARQREFSDGLGGLHVADETPVDQIVEHGLTICEVIVGTESEKSSFLTSPCPRSARLSKIIT